MRRGGFTIFELVLSAAILLVMLAAALPSYRKNLAERGAQGAAHLFEAEYRQAKQRSVALGTYAGLCVGSNTLEPFAFHPFASGAVEFQPEISLKQAFNAPLVVSVLSSGSYSGINPCPAGTALVQLSPYAYASGDWQGVARFSSGGDSWQVSIQGGEIADGP